MVVPGPNYKSFCVSGTNEWHCLSDNCIVGSVGTCGFAIIIVEYRSPHKDDFCVSGTNEWHYWSDRCIVGSVGTCGFAIIIFEYRSPHNDDSVVYLSTIL
jgi:hypothetical protein